MLWASSFLSQPVSLNRADLLSQRPFPNRPKLLLVMQMLEARRVVPRNWLQQAQASDRTQLITLLKDACQRLAY